MGGLVHEYVAILLYSGEVPVKWMMSQEHLVGYANFQ